MAEVSQKPVEDDPLFAATRRMRIQDEVERRMRLEEATEQRNAAAAVEKLTWTVAEAAASLGVSERTLKRMQARGELPEGVVVHLRDRRMFNPILLRAWVAEGCPKPVRKRR